MAEYDGTDDGPSSKKHKRECSYRPECHSNGVRASKKGTNFAVISVVRKSILAMGEFDTLQPPNKVSNNSMSFKGIS